MLLFKKRKKFGEIAVTKGLITKWQLNQVLVEQNETRIKGIVYKKSVQFFLKRVS